MLDTIYAYTDDQRDIVRDINSRQILLLLRLLGQVSYVRWTELSACQAMKTQVTLIKRLWRSSHISMTPPDKKVGLISEYTTFSVVFLSLWHF